MGLTMLVLEVLNRGKEKKSVVKEIALRYKKARKKLKGAILNEFEALTGYVRCLRPNRNNGRKHKDIEYAFYEAANAAVTYLQDEDTHFRGY